MSDFAMESARGRAPDDGDGSLPEARLRTALSAQESRTRQDAALALVDRARDGNVGAETREALAEAARTDDDPDVRQFAVEALGATGGPVAPLTAALSDDDEWVRAEAVVALSRVDGDVAEAIRAVADDDSGWVRRNAVIALCKRGAADWDLLVDRLKNDPHPPSREYAAAFLPEYADEAGDEDAVRLLAAVLARDQNAFVRAKAAVSLGDLGTERAEEALEAHGLPDRSDDVQRAAKRALASARGEDPEEVDVAGCGPDAPSEDLAPGRAGASTDGPQYGGPPSGPGPSPSREGFGGPDSPHDGPGGPGY